jgi:2-hydroxymuconate-semialdehyde hydrolase
LSKLHESDLPFEGTTIHCWRGGQGHPLILLHGSGAGVGTFSNFKAVVEPLSRHFDVLASDALGYGKSGRRSKKPYFDIDMWVRQTKLLIDQFDGRKVGLVGHSLAGSFVLKAAVGDPRVAGVVTTGTTGTRPRAKEGGVRWLFPDGRAGIQRHVERTLFNKALADEAEIDSRIEVLMAPGYREYFESMFSEDRNVYLEAAALSDQELQGITCPVLLMHGRNDESFAPEETSLVLADKLANADVFVLARCAHSVALEYPDKFVAAVRAHFKV